MPVTIKGLRLLLIGVLVMILGFILLAGGGSSDPNVFNTAMFDFRRLVLAPIIIIAGVVIDIFGIMNVSKK